MPKKAKIEKTATGKILKVLNPNAAGIDIASSEMQVCVPEDRDSEWQPNIRAASRRI